MLHFYANISQFERKLYHYIRIKTILGCHGNQ